MKADEQQIPTLTKGTSMPGRDSPQNSQFHMSGSCHHTFFALQEVNTCSKYPRGVWAGTSLCPMQTFLWVKIKYACLPAMDTRVSWQGCFLTPTAHRMHRTPCHLGWCTLLKCNETNHACLPACLHRTHRIAFWLEKVMPETESLF